MTNPFKDSMAYAADSICKRITFGDSILLSTDWKLLRQQKNWLVTVIQLNDDDCIRPAMEGILSLIDELQDCAAKVLGDEKVFGK